VTARSAAVSEPAASRTEAWIAPPFDGPSTGGTIYNERLCSALGRLGIRCARLGVDEALGWIADDRAAAYWVDSLYWSAVKPKVWSTRG